MTRLFLLLFLALPARANDAVFQYMVPIKTTKAASFAYLWLPPASKHIRGAVVAGMTLAEREIVKDPRVRRACADHDLALVFLKTGIASVDIPEVMASLAKASSYDELATIPLFFVGHSAGGPQAKAAAIKHRDRCFGVMQYRGGNPAGDDPVPPGVPALMMLGHFDEFGPKPRDENGRENWENGRDSLLDFRAKGERNLGSLVVEPGAGHFAWSDRNADYFSLFLRKAASARLPDPKKPGVCKDIDPESGWLSGLTLNRPAHQPAPFKEYRGDKARAAWHFDKEMALATHVYHKDGFGKKDQFLRWADAHWVDAGARNYFHDVKWVGDGQTFKVHPVYADVYPRPQKDGKGPQWPLAGKPVGHSSAPIKVRLVGGHVRAVGADTFRIHHDALAPAIDPGRVTFLAYSDGDEEYRPTELVGMMPRGFVGFTSGKDQKITFPAVASIKAGASPVDLKATSDAGLPVEYYVAFGPAVIENGKLYLAEIPTHASYPIEVKVVAYQFGRGLEPKVKSAMPLERVFKIEKP